MMTGPIERTVLAVLVGYLVLLAGVGVTAAAGTQGASTDATPISECTTIDESGEYLVTENLSSDGDEPCLRIVADDVRVDVQDNKVSPGGSTFERSGIAVRGAANVTVERFVVPLSDPGVLVVESSDVTLQNGTVGEPETDVGVVVRDSSDVVVEDVRVVDQIFGGVVYQNVSEGAILNVTVTDAGDSVGDGAFLRNTTGVEVANNELYGGSAGNSFGLALQDSDGNAVRNNTLPRDEVFPGLLLESSSDNEVVGNDVGGFYLRGTSEGNLIYDNRFTGFREPVRIGSDVGENRWNVTVQRGENVAGGRFVAGNYYATFGSNSSDYSETCTDEDGDGICDEPLELADGNVDAYPLSTNQAEANVTYYQVDLVAGEPIEELGDDRANDYSKQGRLVRYAHGTSEEPVTDSGSNLPSLDADTAECVDSEPIAMDEEENTATVEVTVQKGCEVDLSLVSYEKVGPGWSLARQPTQQFADSETETLGPGTHTLTVDLPDRDDDADG